MNGAERAVFRKAANTLKPIIQIGKEDIGENLVRTVDEALTKRELIKLAVLETSTLNAKEAANQLSETLGADVIQCIGRKFVLYRKKPEEDG